MQVSRSGRSCLLAMAAVIVAMALNACASGTSGSADAQASNVQPKRWNENNLIQPNQLLPNGLRPLRYFYW